MWVALAFAKPHIFQQKNTCELDIVLTRTVNIFTSNELVKLTTLWTTGSWFSMSGQHMSQRTTKPTIRLCDQRRLRSASASAQSDQSLRWSHVPYTAAGLSKEDKREPLPHWVDVQADLNLCWSHRSDWRFCRALAHMYQPAHPRNIIRVEFDTMRRLINSIPSHKHAFVISTPLNTTFI